MIGINNRNLEDFSVDIQRTFDLLADVPAGKVVGPSRASTTASRSRSWSRWAWTPF